MSARIDSATIDKLVARAKRARLRAYAPYSGYHVGAAVLGASGKIHVGCNVENATYGATVCAERNAILHMVAAGDREPRAIAIVTQGKTPGTPCGICRQTLVEFTPDLPIVLVSVDGTRERRRRTSLHALLPDPFDPRCLEDQPG